MNESAGVHEPRFPDVWHWVIERIESARRTGDQMAKRRFTVSLEPAEEGGYVVTVPVLPGCVTQGETREEALEMARDAIAAHLASLAKHGEPLPRGLGEIEAVEVDVPSV